MLIDSDPNLTELLFYSIKIRLSIEDLAVEIGNIRHSLEHDQRVLVFEDREDLSHTEEFRR